MLRENAISIMLAYFARDEHLFASSCLVVSIDTGHKALMPGVTSRYHGSVSADRTRWVYQVSTRYIVAFAVPTIAMPVSVSTVTVVGMV